MTRPLRKSLEAVSVTVLLGGAAFSATAADPAVVCQSGKLSTAAKYSSCRLKAEAKGIKAGVFPDYSKCSLAKFADAETRGGGSCPTSGDQLDVGTHLDLCTSRVSTWLGGGGGLPDTCAADLAVCLAQPNGQVPKTGQTSCTSTVGVVIPCGGTGQDGETQNGRVRSFTDNGDGTITDNKTGLMWEKLAFDGSIHHWTTTRNWNDAFATKIASLNTASFAGYGDWRLPSLTELQSIVNFGTSNPSVDSVFHTGCVPGCDVTTCSCTSSDLHWSSTSRHGLPSEAWAVGFLDGDTFADSKFGGYVVRGVRTAL